MCEEGIVEVKATERVDHVSEDSDRVTSHCASEPSASDLNMMFTDRYTKANESFAKICKGFEPVICMHPFHSRPKRNFDNNSGDHRGGRGFWNRGRGDWRGGRGRGGDHWRSNDRRGQRRPWNGESDHGSDRGDRKFRRD
ncbi:hypothetical protein ANCCAN_16231 [Ancylostoma caninum]|uniref:Uncharacterized protein n=1 Tax=Ancylostoma caninum TaxID=29170 RepID=A0A368G093_ANCCA|nr:hypothetical protein ANCCAN_16231 [Ancylostoma caninum]